MNGTDVVRENTAAAVTVLREADKAPVEDTGDRGVVLAEVYLLRVELHVQLTL